MRFFCAIMVMAVAAGLDSGARAELVNAIRVVVHDSIITYQQVEDSAAPAVDQLRLYRSQPGLYEKKLKEALDDSQEQLVERQLILHDFESSTIYAHFPESIIDEQLQTYIRSTYGDDRVRFIKTLQAEGKTYEQFRKDFRDHLIVQEMRYLHGSSEAIVSPHKIEVYYVDHTDQFKVESQVKLRMIVLNKPAGDTNETRKLAEEILAKISEGAAFAEMASVYSQGSQRSQGGDWGWVEKSVLRNELADKAFSLKPGERSGVIETPEACYLMLVEDRRAEHIKPLGEVRNDIEKTLVARERDRLQKQWVERLKKKTFVRVFY